MNSLFIVLFYLGCAKPLDVVDFKDFHKSKHYNNRKRGKYQLRAERHNWESL